MRKEKANEKLKMFVIIVHGKYEADNYFDFIQYINIIIFSLG